MRTFAGIAVLVLLGAGMAGAQTPPVGPPEADAPHGRAGLAARDHHVAMETTKLMVGIVVLSLPGVLSR